MQLTPAMRAAVEVADALRETGNATSRKVSMKRRLRSTRRL